MATQVQWRGGSTAEHATFTGAAREVTVDTQKQTLVVHDGSTAGGEALLREDQANLPGSVTNGIYTPGTNQVAVATNGTGRLFIDSSGNVGIGTASPNDYANYSTLTLNDTTGSIIDFEANGTICGELQALANEFRINAVGASGVLKMYAGGSERMRITSAGLVGIGTSAPSESNLMCPAVLEESFASHLLMGVSAPLVKGLEKLKCIPVTDLVMELESLHILKP
jgi:hypothetical protein